MSINLIDLMGKLKTAYLLGYINKKEINDFLDCNGITFNKDYNFLNTHNKQVVVEKINSGVIYILNSPQAVINKYGISYSVVMNTLNRSHLIKKYGIKLYWLTEYANTQEEKVVRENANRRCSKII